jgi:hypothetical protein
VHDSLWHNKALPRGKFHGAILEINQKLALDYVEEFIVGVMFVPMIFALHDAKAHDGLVHLAQRLVVPLRSGRIRHSLLFNHLERPVKNVQVSLVGKGLCLAHRKISRKPLQGALSHAPAAHGRGFPSHKPLWVNQNGLVYTPVFSYEWQIKGLPEDVSV